MIEKPLGKWAIPSVRGDLTNSINVLVNDCRYGENPQARMALPTNSTIRQILCI